MVRQVISSKVYLACCVVVVALSLLGARQRPAGRILGVLDDATGLPNHGRRGIDLATGTKAVALDTSAISLACPML